MDFVKSIMPFVSWLWVVIVLIICWAVMYISSLEKRDLDNKRHWIDMIPSGVSTLGVLGTFLGITLGLICFDTTNLTESIPQLLEGLKTAFFTSLAGMIGSLILSRMINKKYDQASGGVSDLDQAAGIIARSVQDLHNLTSHQANAQSQFYQSMVTSMADLKNASTSLSNMFVIVNNMATALRKVEDATTKNASISYDTNKAVEHMVDIVRILTKEARESFRHIEEIKNGIGNLEVISGGIATASTALVTNTETTKNSLSNIETATSSIVPSVGNIEEQTQKQTDLMEANEAMSQNIFSRLGEITDHTEAMVSTEGEVSLNIVKLTDKLHGEVTEIEDKMTETNALLSKKFDEFSELLKKNNTEALVEVMKKVTEEFQKQMNALISKLVQENFEQLNKSVEKLNTWQVENKEMIQSLTSQYKQMATNFENTSTSLTKVKDDTKSLVSEGGKLDTLVKSLNDVIIKDEKFKQISSDLQKTADLSKSNMENFDESTRKLNEWVKKQRNFSDSVNVLIQKLQELNEMRDYASQFWKDTKDGMNEAVGIIKNGTQSLNNQLTDLDQHFYARLSTTLAQLDACIQAIITNNLDE